MFFAPSVARDARLSPPSPAFHHGPDTRTFFFNGVLAHEAYGASGAHGHQGRLELAAKSLPTCGRTPEILERVVAGDSMTAQVVIFEGEKSLFAASGHNYVYGNFSDAPIYEVVSTTTLADSLPWCVDRGDPQLPADSAVSPDPRYKCPRAY